MHLLCTCSRNERRSALLCTSTGVADQVRVDVDRDRDRDRRVTETLRHERDVGAAREQQRRVHVPEPVQRHLGQPDVAAHRLEQARHELGAQRLPVLVREQVPAALPLRAAVHPVGFLCDLPGDERTDRGVVEVHDPAPCGRLR